MTPAERAAEIVRQGCDMVAEITAAIEAAVAEERAGNAALRKILDRRENYLRLVTSREVSLAIMTSTAQVLLDEDTGREISEAVAATRAT